ncbi:hypothetical protein N9B82_04590 [Saprospiraceae bacterium]|nr:hypothetical protein [Saprospiraceae bacterium]
MTIIPTLHELWKKEQCPLVNGVIFNDGAIIECSNTDSSSGKLQFEEKSRTTILELLKHDATGYKNLYHSTIQKVHQSYKYMAGEGSWGGDGYVACFDLKTDVVLWIFTTDTINPIIDLEFSNEKIIAKNNLDSIFSIEVVILKGKRAIVKQIH